MSSRRDHGERVNAGAVSSAAPVVMGVVAEHFAESDALRSTRSHLLRAPHVRLFELRRHDERLAAHLDGLRVAGVAGRGLCLDAIASGAPGPGQVFASAVVAIENHDRDMLDRLIECAEQDSGMRSPLVSAFGWVTPSVLRGITGPLLSSAAPLRRSIGLSACAMHGVDPGPPLVQALSAADASLDAALAAAARLGRRELLPACLARLDDTDEERHYLAARAALLLGDRQRSIAALKGLATRPGAARNLALGWLLKVLPTADARGVIASLSTAAGGAEHADAASKRRLLRAVALAGDTHYMPWLIQQMRDPVLTRAAGEAFTMVTGVDLERAGLAGPVAVADPEPETLGEDDGLDGPDADKVSAWWAAEGGALPAGRRWFMGASPEPGPCWRVLRDGRQRQRAAAADHLALQAAGPAMFEVRAPAWRQQRLIDAQVAP